MPPVQVVVRPMVAPAPQEAPDTCNETMFNGFERTILLEIELKLSKRHPDDALG